jgi:hypothetical protein
VGADQQEDLSRFAGGDGEEKLSGLILIPADDPIGVIMLI